jgi:hypothetical protein
VEVDVEMNLMPDIPCTLWLAQVESGILFVTSTCSKVSKTLDRASLVRSIKRHHVEESPHFGSIFHSILLFCHGTSKSISPPKREC